MSDIWTNLLNIAENKVLPGHLPASQETSCVLAPGHVLPLFDGAGLEQVLIWLFEPNPHETEHRLLSCHGDQLPSTIFHQKQSEHDFHIRFYSIKYLHRFDSSAHFSNITADRILLRYVFSN